jgi:hypothetical protein
MGCNFSHEKALKEEETLLQYGTINTSDVESKDNSPFSHKYFVLHEIANMNILCFLY